MRMCSTHFDGLRERVTTLGLGDLIVTDAETATEQLADQLAQEEVTAVNFDPLMSAHWGVCTNAMEMLATANPSVVGYLMEPEERSEDVVELATYPNGALVGDRLGAGVTWPRCPLCYLNMAHELTCRDRKCSLPKVDGHDWMLDRAAKEAHKKAVQLGVAKDDR